LLEIDQGEEERKGLPKRRDKEETTEESIPSLPSLPMTFLIFTPVISSTPAKVGEERRQAWRDWMRLGVKMPVSFKLVSTMRLAFLK